MPPSSLTQLSRRERQIMHVVFRLGEATATDVMGELLDPPGYSAVRSALAILVDKGYLTFRKRGRQYVYCSAVSTEEVESSAARQLLGTFFKGNVLRAVSALLNVSEEELTNNDLDKLSAVIEQARKEEH